MVGGGGNGANKRGFNLDPGFPLYALRASGDRGRRDDGNSYETLIFMSNRGAVLQFIGVFRR